MIRAVSVVCLASAIAVTGAVPAHADVEAGTVVNAQEGDNTATTDQDGVSSSGDAISGGQVISTASSGNTTINATNFAIDSTSTTGDVSGSNAESQIVGQVSGASTQAVVTDEGVFHGYRTASMSMGPTLSVDPTYSAAASVPEGEPGPTGPPGIGGPRANSPLESAGADDAVPARSEAAVLAIGTLGPIGPIAP